MYNLVHGIVPDVYYMYVHEVWRFVPQTDAQDLKKKQLHYGRLTRCVRELYLTHAP